MPKRSRKLLIDRPERTVAINAHAIEDGQWPFSDLPPDKGACPCCTPTPSAHAEMTEFCIDARWSELNASLDQWTAAEDVQYSSGRKHVMRDGRVRRVRRSIAVTRFHGAVVAFGGGNVATGRLLERRTTHRAERRRDATLADRVEHIWNCVRAAADVDEATRIVQHLERVAPGFHLCGGCAGLVADIVAYADQLVEPIETWTPSLSADRVNGWRPYDVNSDHGFEPHVLGGLVEHCFHRFDVPRWLAMPHLEPWRIGATLAGAQVSSPAVMLGWHVHAGAGRSLRTLPQLPFPLSRAAAHRLVEMPKAIGQPRQALLSSKWLSAGVADNVAHAVCQQVAFGTFESLAEAERLIHWLGRTGPYEDGGELRHLLDYYSAAARRDPAFRVRGFGRRSRQTIGRETAEWVERLIAARAEAARADAARADAARPNTARADIPRITAWSSCGVPPLLGYAGTDGETWDLVELCTTAALDRETREMRHCVASYAERASHGGCAIFSIRARPATGRATPRALATIELRAQSRTIVQARGKWNAPLDPSVMACVAAWAAQQKLRMEL